MINIEFTKDKHEYYGRTGVQLYAVKSENLNGEKRILIDKNAKAIDLYKLYHDINIFLCNDIDPLPNEKNIKTYPIFGNSKHAKFIRNKKEYQVVGFLNKEDIENVVIFLNTNALEKEASVQKYFDSLNQEVKEELQILLEDRIVWELHGYLESMVIFLNDCSKNTREVVIIANS